MAKRAWGPGNPLWEWKRRNGKKSRSSSPSRGRRMVRRTFGRRRGRRTSRGRPIPVIRTATRALLAFRALVGGPQNAQKLLAGDLSGWWAYQRTIYKDGPAGFYKNCKSEINNEIVAEVAGKVVPGSWNKTFRFAGKKWKIL